MDVLLFSLNGIAPVILTVLLGYILKRVGLFGENLISGLNQLCFQALLPIMLFYNIQSSDFFSGFDISFILLYFRTGISPHKTPSKPVSTPLEGAMI